MQKVIEVQDFSFSFILDGIDFRDKSFEAEHFNYGGSLYQKFKSKVPVELHDYLKAMKDVSIYVDDGFTSSFKFFIEGQNESSVRVVAIRIISICKAVHGYTNPIEFSIVKRMLVDEISDVIVA
jgi:hypothetical protein